MLSLVVNILTKENLESARDTVDIRNTVTKYGEERLRDKVELVLREIVGIPATVEFPTPSRGHLSRKPSFREATRNLIVFQTFDALKRNMWNSRCEIIRITRGLIIVSLEIISRGAVFKTIK